MEKYIFYSCMCSELRFRYRSSIRPALEFSSHLDLAKGQSEDKQPVTVAKAKGGDRGGLETRVASQLMIKIDK